jgi:ferrous iron transport protein B
MAAIWRETGPRWALFASLWTTGLGYGAAVVAYQTGTFARHPASSTAWIAGIFLAFAALVITMRIAGERREQAPMAVAAE